MVSSGGKHSEGLEQWAFSYPGKTGVWHNTFTVTAEDRSNSSVLVTIINEALRKLQDNVNNEK